MSQYYFLQLGKRTGSVKFFFSIKTLDNVFNISELSITYFFQEFNSLSSISTQDSFLPASLFENTEFAFVT